MDLSSNILRVFSRSTVPLSLANPNLPDSPLVLVNQPFCMLTGYEKSEVIGRNCRFLQGSRRDQHARGEIRDAIDAGVDTQVLFTNVTRTDEEFENLVFLYHIRGADGNVLYHLGSQFKMTTRASASPLDTHLLSLTDNLHDMTDNTHRVRVTARRQVSNSLATVLRSSVIQERLADFRG